ncbi:FAD-dependent thymidylate synthase [Nonomuraea jabiensis]|uniref:FAD-dependent thymidylate synthase n=1 Tax=Nonomuraea jabiensis TaxID=882448 RepID=UPI0034404DA5
MEVELLASTTGHASLWRWIESVDPEPFDDDTYGDLLPEYAGRTCYRSYSRPRPETATNESYLHRTVVEQHHESIMEHSSASFRVTGVSRHLLGELTRHRFLSFSVESLRYCPPRDYAVHPTLAEFDLVNDLNLHWQASLDYYHNVYDYLISKGLKKKQAAEAAAQFLPLATSTDLVVSGNFRAWRDVLGKRIDPAANAEIRELANKILTLLKDIAPNSFQDFEDGTWTS